MVEFRINVKELKRKLEEFARRAQDLEAKKEVVLSELLPPDFLQRNTQFRALDDLFKASGFSVSSLEDFEKIPEAQWDAFIAKHTRFTTWDQMFRAALEEWTLRQLGL